MLTVPNERSDCNYQRRLSEGEAHCELLAELIGRDRQTQFVVPISTCSACCRQSQPTPLSPNSVVASLLLEQLDVQRSLGRMQPDDEQLKSLAIAALECSYEGQPLLESLIDHAITADVLAQRVELRQPFLLLRFGDGEWISVLGSSGYNCDGHDFLPETMGRELGEVLLSLSASPNPLASVFVGSTCELSLEIRPFLSRLATPERIHWVSDAVFRLGMSNLQTRRFVIACQQFRGRKVLVGDSSLRPVARALNAYHVIIPRENCYLEIDEIERACQEIAPELLLCCASMASECLLWRLWKLHSNATLIDCGSIFDVMLQRPIRSEYHGWSELIAEQYFPIFSPFCSDDEQH